jgi:prepilin-type N-terminal cleavage/methylation domain-containing protein
LRVKRIPHAIDTARIVGCLTLEAQVARANRGLTLVEVLIALIVLGVGILALSGSSSMITRMIGRGKSETHAAMAASRRVELLRQAARSSTPRCIAAEFTSGGPVIEDGLTQSWTITPTGPVRRVRVTVTYLTVRGLRTAVLETAIAC